MAFVASMRSHRVLLIKKKRENEKGCAKNAVSKNIQICNDLYMCAMLHLRLILK